jgi:hypothetical protein
MRNHNGPDRGGRWQPQRDGRPRGWVRLTVLLGLGFLSACLAGCPRATPYRPNASLVDTLGVPEAAQQLKETLLRALAPQIVAVDVTEEFLRYRYRQEIAGIATGALPEQRLAFLNVAQVDIFPDNTVNILADNRLLLAQLVFGSRQDAELFADLMSSFRARRTQARGR